jgi:two-component system nitrate/nitrite response regulator NarL
MTMPIRLVMVDDHPLVLGGLEQLLRGEPDFEVAETCSTAAQGWEAIRLHEPDVLVLDLNLPDADGLSLLKRLDPTQPPAVVVLTAAQDENVLLDAARLGARGIVLKAMAPRVLENCLRVVHGGGQWLHVDGLDVEQRLRRRLEVEAELQHVLTPRELDILRLADLPLDNEAIAGRLSITVGTVKIHLHHVFDKLQLTGRRDLQSFLRAKGY